MTRDNPHVPPQTITMSSEQLGREAARWAISATEQFTVYRSGPDVRLRCHKCNQTLVVGHTEALSHLVGTALTHKCERAGE